jgi:hypothetical protein
MDRSREFISLLAYICADRTTILLALIYKGASYDLQSSWLDNVGDDNTYFAASKNRWSCNSLSLQWLEKVFD